MLLFNNLYELLFIIPAFLVAITVHEYAHGRASTALGDPTPKMSGRLSLNPLKHLDFLGTLMILLVGFGWAKPVPVNPNYYRNPRRGMALVGLAGPFTNFATAIIVGRLGSFVLGFFTGGGLIPLLLVTFFEMTVIINVILGSFNLVPIPPLDGSKVLAYFIPDHMLRTYWKIEQYGILILLMVLFFFREGLWRMLGPVANFVLNIAGLPSAF